LIETFTYPSESILGLPPTNDMPSYVGHDKPSSLLESSLECHEPMYDAIANVEQRHGLYHTLKTHDEWKHGVRPMESQKE